MSEQQKAALDAQLRQAPLDVSVDLKDLRDGFEEVMRHIPTADNVTRRHVTVGGVGAVEVTIDGTDPSGVILYFHGGVYVIGSAEASVPLVADLAARTGAKVLTVDYRLAPENPYPAPVEDARAAYEGLLSEGVDPGDIVVAGESAGGGLAVALLLALRDDGVPLPAAGYVMSPWADLTLTGASIVERQTLDPLLTGEGLRWGVSHYAPDADLADPWISPVYGDLRQLPPLLIQVGSHEILLSDATRLATRAAESDVAVTLDVVPGVPHVFQAYAAILDEGNAALDRAASFMAATMTETRRRA